MRKKGRITTWNDDKGYGFITAMIGDERVFVHIKAFANRSRRPAVGDVVTFSVSTDERGRPQAEAVTIAGVPQPSDPRPSSTRRPYWTAAGFLLIVCTAAIATIIPLSVMVVYLLASIATYAAYAMDKSAAREGAWRTSESTLHLLSLAGGWPGALVAQSRFRHKTKKQPFRFIFWITVVLNCAVLAWLFTPTGAATWQSIMSAIA